MTEVVHGLERAQRERVAALRARGRFFWIDVSLDDASRADMAEVLEMPDRARRALDSSDARSRTLYADGESVVFKLHCYTESAASGQATGYRLRPIGIRVLITAEYLLTVHEEPVSLPDALAADLPEGRSKAYVVYAVLDAMAATSIDALEEVEHRLDGLAASWTDGGGGRVPRAALAEAGARLATMRRWVRSEQAVSERIGMEVEGISGFGRADESYFDRLEEQADRLLGSVDAAANGLAMLLDLQLNERAYLVSVLATIFVPMTFITGYFGMNFGWMVDRIDSPVAFLLLGLLVPVGAGVLSWRLLIRRFFKGDPA